MKWITKKEKIIYTEGNDSDENKDLSSLPDGSNKMINLPLVGGCMHNKKSKARMDAVDKKHGLRFLREAILAFANERGFLPLINGDEKPVYVTAKMWKSIIEHQTRSYHVDFSYVVAFCFLWSLPEFNNYNRSRILRKIIIQA